MAIARVQLLGIWACPYVNRVQIALNLKSIDYEFIQENPPTKSDLLLKTNPVYKKIPVLIHDGKPICDSVIIVQYIDDAWRTNDPPILPSDPDDRAFARFWATYIDKQWYPLYKELREASREETRKEIIEKIFEGSVLLEAAFVKCSKGKPFFGGENVGYTDIVLGGCMGWIKATELIIGMKFFDEVKTPGLAIWKEQMCSCNAVKQVVPETQKLVENQNMIQRAKSTFS